MLSQSAQVAKILLVLSSLLIIVESTSENHPDEEITREMTMPPYDLLVKISNSKDIDEYLQYINTSLVDSKHHILKRRFMDKINSIQPRMATCMPVPTVIRLPLDLDNKTGTYFPSCTRVNRCGGSCAHHQLRCQSTATEIINIEVVESFFTTHGQQTRKVYFDLYQDTKCQCGCKQYPKDCNNKQQYVKGECSCVCKNVQPKKECEKEVAIKHWDPNVCDCLCNNTCVKPDKLDVKTCECKKPPFSN